jgi:hypothetical protein
MIRENSNSKVETNAAHIIDVSLKMACEVWPKHVGELINKYIIQCNKLVLILCVEDIGVH